MQTRCRHNLFASLALLTFVGLASMAMTACGSDDPCANKTCEFGTCDSDSGQCINEETCNVDADCIPGYLCGNDGACVAQNECESDSDCSAGVCNDDGVCVNGGDGCESNADCVERTYCAESDTCERDPCLDKTCRRGVCKRGTDKCVSADSCTAETELLDCVSGQKCANGTCASMDTFCENITCDRGVCSFEAGGCANAQNCEGDRQNCLDGFFCNDMNRCRPNLCERNDVECDRGVCVPATGECQNDTSCESTSDCLPDHLCVEGTCRLESVACGDAGGDGGCPGNQVCDYDADTLTASCAEPADCQSSFDCKDDRVCGGRSCLDPISCRGDRFEPNNSAEESISLTSISPNQLVKPTLCQGDVDWFSIDTTEVSEPTSSTTLLVSLELAERDRGLGQVDVTVLKDGSPVASGSTGAKGDNARVDVPVSVGISEQGVFDIRVTAGDSMSTAGVDYTLSAAGQTEASKTACNTGTELRPNQEISGDTSASDSTSLTASCISDSGSAPEKVYPITVEAPQRVTFTVSPQLSSTDLAVSLRGRCQFPGTERACTSSADPGEDESLTALLDPGTYYVVVQPTGGNSGGPFSLSVSTTFTACSPATSFCQDAQTANVCATGGGRFTSIDCEADCNPSTGRCFPPEGDRCNDAPSITPESGTSDGPITREVDLRQLDNNYEIAPDGCIEGEPRTDGPEQALKVTVPSKKSVKATVQYTNEVKGSVYLVDDCSDTDGTCQAGVVDSTDEPDKEVLQYSNVSDQSETKFLIIDTAGGQPFDRANVTIEYIDVICSPGMKQCTSAGNVETCGEFGTTYNQTDVCGDFACDMGACQRPDSCMSPVNPRQGALQSGGISYSEKWSTFTDNLGGSADTNSCDIGSDFRSAPETVWEIPLNAGEALRASVTSSDPVDNDPSMAIQSSCGDLTDMNCIDGEEANNEPAVATYVASQNETVYAVGDADGDDNSETLTANFEIYSSACSSQGASCDGSGNVQVCSGQGEVPSTFTCANSCSSGFCSPRTSDFCFDAEDVTSTLRGSGGLNRSVNFGSFSNDIEFSSCGVSGFETDGPDAVYKVDMQANEVLSATLDADGSSDQPTLMVLENCFDPSAACLAGKHGSDTSTVNYETSTAKTVYLVADVDDSTSDTFQLSGKLEVPFCTPLSGSCASNGDVQFCEAFGINQPTYSCSNCCSTALSDSGTPNKSIPDNDTTGITETATLSSCPGTISKVLVYVDITHFSRGDISIDLTSPAGTTVDIKDTSGSFDDNVKGLYPETLTPSGSMSSFNGEDPSGDWSLKVADEDAFSTGDLNAWAVVATCN